MLNQKRGISKDVWLDPAPAPREAFNDGNLWVGRHSADQDILVFDPSEVDPFADPISFYSLGQHRIRTFPRTIVLQRIHVLTEDIGAARAHKDYARRTELRSAQQEALAADRSERDEQQRQGVIEAHRRYVEALGITYGGVQDDADRRRGRRTRCQACGISLDDFAGAACAVCAGVLCSCGACACGSSSAKAGRAGEAKEG
jgi:hypothetical protein